MHSRMMSKQNSAFPSLTMSRPRRTPHSLLPRLQRNGRLSYESMTRAWLTYVRRHAPSFSAGSRPSVNAACRAITKARTPSSQSKTTSWRVSCVRTCAERPLNLPRPVLSCTHHLRHYFSHSRPLRRHRSPFLFPCNAIDRGKVRFQLAQPRIHCSPPLPLPRLAHSPQDAVTLLRNIPPPDPSHFPLPHPRPPSLPPRAYYSHHHHTVPTRPRWIGVMRDIVWLCRNW